MQLYRTELLQLEWKCCKFCDSIAKLVSLTQVCINKLLIRNTESSSINCVFDFTNITKKIFKVASQHHPQIKEDDGASSFVN